MEGCQFEVPHGVVAFAVARLVGCSFSFSFADANILAFVLSKRGSALSVIQIVSFCFCFPD
jgi:hypothetical protein